MSLLGGALTIKSVSFLMFSVFAIAALGYILGRITIKGVNLGTAGVFVIALLYGCFFYNVLADQFGSYTTTALKTVENMGLIMFVTPVGFIAGPKFFGNFIKNFKSYITLGFIIILTGGLACVVCLLIAKGTTSLSMDELKAMMVGLLSGALTSTPAFSASKEAVGEGLEGIVSVGYGIAYLFGVIGVVLFVQIIPKILKADMNVEREKLTEVGETSKKKYTGKVIYMDDFGLMPFTLAAVLGILLGSIKIGNFSLTTTGGCLIVSLIAGHFGLIKFRKMSSKKTLKLVKDDPEAEQIAIKIMPSDKALKAFRELGLMLFLIGAGVSGGANFVKYFQPIYFVYGMLMTLLPMIIGFFFAKYVLKMHLLNNLGSITGGMTSTPALGTLIHVSGTEDVASAYAATYPIALISVVVICQLIIIIF